MQGTGESFTAQDPESLNFGQHVHSCRRARGFTQEDLASASGLAADTIRRLEHESFSPSLKTLLKLSAGLGLTLTTLVETFELNHRNTVHEVTDLVMLMKPRERRVILRLIPLVRQLIRGEDLDESESVSDGG